MYIKIHTIALIAAAAFFIAPTQPLHAQQVPSDTLVKASGPAVYYHASNGKRYVFPTEGVYFSWFSDFTDIIEITDTQLASLPLGGNVTYRPGIRTVKIQTDPKVYAVDRYGVLRWVTSETVAKMLYGTSWNKNVHDISDAYFVNYQIGEPIYLNSNYRPLEVASGAMTINADKNLTASDGARLSDTIPNIGDAAQHELSVSTGTVSSVIDGDTFTLSNGLRVRLIGINAPEIGQPYSEEAKSELERLVLGKTVYLESDITETDAYGRLLKYAYVGTEFVNKEIVLAGLADAVAYEPDITHQNQLDSAENEARTQGRGMWTLSNTSSDIVIIGFHYNADGDDNLNPNDEFFTLRNDGNTAVDMTGWRARDEAMHSYIFPQFILPAGSTVTIHSGGGINSAGKLYWNNDAAIWNNDGDTLQITDSLGMSVLTFGY